MDPHIGFSRTGMYLAAAALLWLPLSAAAADRPLVWVDACEGEPAEYAQVVEDLGKARVVYLGERHTLERHHATQAKLIADLARSGGTRWSWPWSRWRASQQPGIDRFNRGEIDFDGLAAAIDWAKRWPNYQQYRPVLEAARKAKAPVIGLSPSPEVIRAVVRSGGVDRLDSKLRKQLPAEMDFKDPVYEKLPRGAVDGPRGRVAAAAASHDRGPNRPR